jgi:hypothetical protein
LGSIPNINNIEVTYIDIARACLLAVAINMGCTTTITHPLVVAVTTAVAFVVGIAVNEG